MGSVRKKLKFTLATLRMSSTPICDPEVTIVTAMPEKTGRSV